MWWWGDDGCGIGAGRRGGGRWRVSRGGDGGVASFCSISVPCCSGF